MELVCNLQEGKAIPSLSLSLTADLAHATFSSFRSDDYDGRIHRSSYRAIFPVVLEVRLRMFCFGGWERAQNMRRRTSKTTGKIAW